MGQKCKHPIFLTISRFLDPMIYVFLNATIIDFNVQNIFKFIFSYDKREELMRGVMNPV